MQRKGSLYALLVVMQIGAAAMVNSMGVLIKTKQTCCIIQQFHF